MSEGTPNPQINVSKIVTGGGIAGALFAVISTVIFLIGIPAMRYFLPAAAVLGCLVALAIRFQRHETPGKPWILANPSAADGGVKPAPAAGPSHHTLIPAVNLS